jgi:acyl carrier protein
MINTQEFYHGLEEILELDPHTITGNEDLSEYSWDSMAVVMFIAMADSKFNIAVAPSKLAGAQTVADLLAIISPQTP